MITDADKLQCIERELGYRRRIYQRLIERGKMTRADAERELGLMAAIAEDYRAAADADAPQLFIETKRTVKQGC